MADVKIGDTELTFDLEKITITEYRDFAKGSFTDGEDDSVLAKVTGQPVEYFSALSQPAYRRVLVAFFKKAREPLSDPN